MKYSISNKNHSTVEQHEIEFDTANPACPQAFVSLISVLGSDGIHLCIKSEDDEIVKQVQYKCRQNETLEVTINTNEKRDSIDLVSTNKQLVQLPSDRYYLPEKNTFEINNNETIDILFILDSTMLSSSLNEDYQEAEFKTKFLLDNDEFNKALTEKINKFIKSLDSENIQYSILSYADKPISGVNSNELKPKFTLDPSQSSDRYFHNWNENRIREDILQVISSSGGDYVDELAEALNVASTDYNWRPNARHLVYIIGDSPGFSLLSQAPSVGETPANAVIRHVDIDSQIMNLHQQDIEIMSLYIADQHFQRSTKGLDKLKLYTQQQYRELATLEEYSNIWASWNPEESAKLFLSKEQLVVGRGYCYPIIK